MITVSHHDDLIGLILVGGESSRMQSPKAYLLIDNQPQWQRAQAWLTPYVSATYFSSSPKLTPPLAVPMVIMDLFKDPIGPLGGIISAFKQHKHSALFVLACDLLQFGEEGVRYLISERDPRKMATAYVSDSGIEPLCTIYEPTIFPELITAWSEDRFCPRAILKNLDIKLVTPNDMMWLRNANKRDDLPMQTQRKSVNIYFYASLREDAGANFITHLTSMTTISDVYIELANKFSLSAALPSLRCALNNRIVESSHSVNDGDEIVFIPPVSGG